MYDFVSSIQSTFLLRICCHWNLTGRGVSIPGLNLKIFRFEGSSSIRATYPALGIMGRAWGTTVSMKGGVLPDVFSRKWQIL